MRKMKDSGIEWIGEIPENWDAVKLSYLFEIIGSGTTPTSTNSDYYDGEYNWLQTGDLNDKEITTTSKTITQKAVDDYSTLTLYNKGTIVMAMYGATIGKLGILNIDSYTNQACCAMSRPVNIQPKFVYYWLMCNKENIVNLSMGGGQPNISQGIISTLKITIPKEITKQNEIVKYLDKKCAEIDALIKAKEKTNALLKEQRQSIIYEAVTKGLNPNIPMKDSGIEWIGNIPEHWNTKKIKYCFTLIAGATPKSSNSEYWDGNIVWITPADYKTEDVFIEKGHKNITDEGMQSCATTLIPENCIIFSKRAPVGLVAINRVPLCTNQGCISCIPHNDISSKFYYYVMSVFEEQFELFASGTTFKEISADSFANFLLPNTTFDEQVEIVNYLDKKCAELDTIIKSNRTIIEKLKEYRKSIIFEAVTGKVEI